MRPFPRAALAAFALSLTLMAPAGAADQATVKVSLIDMTAMFGPGGWTWRGLRSRQRHDGARLRSGLRNDGARYGQGMMVKATARATA